MVRSHSIILGLALLGLGLVSGTGHAADGEPAKPKVKLAVLLVFDQLRGDYLDKWQPHFGEGGFKRLQTEGAWYPDCHYPYATTTTGPGHASVLSGCSASKHGIVNNEWYDAKIGEQVYCAASARYTFVPASKPADPAIKTVVKKAKLPGAPDLFLSETVADQLKLATAGKSRVFGLSLKDRSAVLPVGRKPDGAYWFDGQFVTSTYYRDTLHPWVEAVNKNRIADQWYGKDWTHFRKDLDYAKLIGADQQVGEGKGTAQGAIFPHPMDGGKKMLGKEYYEALANSPFGNDLLLALAKECIQAEKLGQGSTADLLSLSFSSNDLIGHTWGPDSQEVFDVTLRTDALVADLLTFLDAKVGAGNYSVVVTADHGICPIPEVAAKQGLDAKRISPVKLLLRAERYLNELYAPSEEPRETLPSPRSISKSGGESPKEPATPAAKANRFVEAIVGPNLYLNQRLIKARGLNPDQVAERLAKFLQLEDGIQRVYTRKQRTEPKDQLDELNQRVRKSYFAERSGDLYLVGKPYYLFDTNTSGTTHGAPHAYDTHVPLIAFGPGVVGGRKTEKVTPLHAAPIMADFLGVKAPKDSEYSVPNSLNKK